MIVMYWQKQIKNCGKIITYFEEF
jgi:hypothetical protein